MLALLFTVQHQRLVKKLILIGSAVFDSENSVKSMQTRLDRLDKTKHARFEYIRTEIIKAPINEQNSLLEEQANLLFQTDVLNPLTKDLGLLECNYQIHKKVWSDFEKIRDQAGILEKKLSKIKIPVVVLHGDYDPHPIDGIKPFLESALDQVTFYILSQCGHYPWIEKCAKKTFFDILRKEIF